MKDDTIRVTVVYTNNRYCVIPRLFGVLLSEEHREYYDCRQDAMEAASDMQLFYEQEHASSLLSIPQIRNMVVPAVRYAPAFF